MPNDPNFERLREKEVTFVLLPMRALLFWPAAW
jgi:hypothetical protein